VRWGRMSLVGLILNKPLYNPPYLLLSGAACHRVQCPETSNLMKSAPA
jgi:hypothetical protein